MRPVLSLFKREKAADTPAATRTLPTAVAAAIDTASLVSRPADENGPRVICQFDGFAGIVFSDQAAHKVMARMWPGMTDNQMSQAIQRIRARVKAHLRGLEITDPKSTPWRDRF